MKRILLFICAWIPFMAFCDKPSIIVMPDNNWMTTNGFVYEEEVQGVSKTYMDYMRAFSESDQLSNITAAIEEVFAGRQFPLVNYVSQQNYREEDEIEREYEDVEDDVTDAIVGRRQRDLAHIRIEVGWTVEADHSITLRLAARDAFSNKSVAAKTYDGFQMSRLTPIRRAIKLGLDSKIDGFVDQIVDYFGDIQENGRECQLTVSIAKGSNINFDSEFDNKTLEEIIKDWLDENTVNSQYSERTTTKNRLIYDQVRVSLKNEKGRQQNMKAFAEKLRKYLRADYKIKSSIPSSEPGSVRLIIE